MIIRTKVMFFNLNYLHIKCSKTRHIGHAYRLCLTCNLHQVFLDYIIRKSLISLGGFCHS